MAAANRVSVGGGKVCQFKVNKEKRGAVVLLPAPALRGAAARRTPRVSTGGARAIKSGRVPGLVWGRTHVYPGESWKGHADDPTFIVVVACVGDEVARPCRQAVSAAPSGRPPV